MKRFMHLSKTKKLVAAGLAVGIALGTAGAAFAYFTSTGTGTGSATTGTATNWTVTPTIGTTALLPGSGSDSVAATVKNVSSGQQALSTIVVQITGVTEGAPGNTFTSEPACSTADYALTASAPWVLSPTSTADDTATYTYGSAQDVAGGDYLSGGIPSGVAVTMLDSGPQDQCQGATVNLSVTAS